MTKKEALRKIDIAIQIAAATGTPLCKVAPEALEIAHKALETDIIREEAIRMMLKERRERDGETDRRRQT